VDLVVEAVGAKVFLIDFMQNAFFAFERPGRRSDY
jgi:hypothetical protein